MVVIRLVGFIFDCLQLDIWGVGLFAFSYRHSIRITLEFLKH